MENKNNIAWQELVKDDIQQVEDKMHACLTFEREDIKQATATILNAGGKRLRPAISILTGRLLNTPHDKMLASAAAVEMLHMATLIHDDLIDGSPLRRGAATVHTQFSPRSTIFIGNFLFAKAAELGAQTNNPTVNIFFANTAVKICEGEFLQASTRWEISDQDQYIKRIYGKTAALFEASTTPIAILSNQPEDIIQAVGNYGRQLGLAFQIVDDVLDFTSTNEELGKPAGNDMRQGIFTLPLIFYVQQNHISTQELVTRIENDDDVNGLVEHIRETQVLNKSLDLARSYAHSAAQSLKILPKGENTDLLHYLTQFAVARSL